MVTDFFMEIPHEPFTAMLAEGAQKARARQKPRWSQHFHASGYTGCLRRTGYQLMHIAAPEVHHNPDNDLAAKQGNILHDEIQGWARAHGSVIVTLPTGLPAIEVDLGGDALIPYHVSGRVDAIIRNPAGQLAILDIKTIKSALMNPMPGSREWKDAQANEKKYFAQLNLYMNFSECFGLGMITRGIIYLISRDETKYRKMGITRYNPEWMAPHLERLRVAAEAVRAGRLPVPEPSPLECRYCDHRKLCPAGNGTGEVVEGTQEAVAG